MSKLIVVHTTAGPMQAEIIRGLLEAAGIPARLSQESAGSVYGFTVGAMGLVDILVPEEFAAQAQEVLDAYEHGELAEDEGEGDDPAQTSQ
jgi:hypothetical protein